VQVRRLVFAVLVLSTAFFGATYVLRFLSDSVGPSTRLRAAAELAKLPADTAIAVDADPAPYSLPPVNLFDRRLVLVPRPFDATPGAFPEPTVLVRPVDAGRHGVVPRERTRWDAGVPTRMSWAAKNFEAIHVGPLRKDVGE
jgi:hypothetical protein